MAPADAGDLAAGPGAPPPRPPYEEQRKPLLQRIFGPLVVAGALLLKFGKVGLLLLTKAKFLTTSASMLVSVAAYALIWGWKFAAGFVALLFIHEMGHYIQLRREGVKPSGMVFIPFLGAAVGARSLGGSALAEARVGLAGPILGSLACLIPAGAVDRHRRGVLAGARVHRLLPQPLQPDPGRAVRRRPRDGGDGAVDVVRRPRRDGSRCCSWRRTRSCSCSSCSARFTTYQRWKTRKAGEEGNADYYRVKPAHRLAVGIVYVGLLVLLGVGMDLTHLERTFSDV